MALRRSERYSEKIILFSISFSPWRVKGESLNLVLIYLKALHIATCLVIFYGWGERERARTRENKREQEPKIPTLAGSGFSLDQGSHLGTVDIFDDIVLFCGGLTYAW